MKLRVIVLTGLVLLSTLSVVQAADLKLASVSFQKALNEVEQGKKAKGLLKTEFDEKQKKLDLKQQELKQLQDEFEKQKAVLSQEALAGKQKNFSDKYLELQKSMTSYREELVGKESKLTAEILKNLKQIIAEIGQKEGYTLIMESSQDAVLYAQAKDDLTDRVIKEYNKRFTAPLKVD